MKMNFFTVIGVFLEKYGWGFAMLVASGLLVALMVEILLKNPVRWLGEKWKDHDGLMRALEGVKMGGVIALTWLLSVWFAQLVSGILALPGGAALLPIWVSLVYVCQYVFSLFGIKGIISWMQRRTEKAEERAEIRARACAERAQRDPLEGLTKVSENLWTDGEGGYFILKGHKVVRV